MTLMATSPVCTIDPSVAGFHLGFGFVGIFCKSLRFEPPSNLIDHANWALRVKIYATWPGLIRAGCYSSNQDCFLSLITASDRPLAMGEGSWWSQLTGSSTGGSTEKLARFSPLLMLLLVGF